MNHRRSMIDPLGKTNTVTYDLAGNPISRIRRTGAISTYSYDALQRLTKQVYDSGTVTRTYDAGGPAPQGRPARAGRSRAPTTRSTASPPRRRAPGTCRYTYDDLGRRQAMQVTSGGQPCRRRLRLRRRGPAPLAHAWRPARHPHLRRQRPAHVDGPAERGEGDHHLRRAGQPTAMTYTAGRHHAGRQSPTPTTPPAGARRPGGSYARIDPAGGDLRRDVRRGNRPLTYGAATLTYDADGNLTGDGTRTYTYDSRDRLMSVSGGSAAATYAYDDLGRRTSASWVAGHPDACTTAPSRSTRRSARVDTRCSPARRRRGLRPAARRWRPVAAARRPREHAGDHQRRRQRGGVLQLRAVRGVDVCRRGGDQPLPVHRPRDRRHRALAPRGPLPVPDARAAG